MKQGRKNINSTRLLMLLCLIGGLTTTSFASLEDKVHKYYSLKTNIFSVNPTQTLDSYKWYGSSSASGNSSCGLACYDQQRNFRVNVSGKNIKQRFIVNVEVTPDKRDSATAADSFEVDFTDLKARSFELAKNEDGRIYMLNLTPGIKIVDNRPVRADDTSFNLSRWSFDNSMVIFNDSFYVGKTNNTGGPMAFVSYPGMAKVEFALEPFREAKRLGTLKDGRIQIRSEDGQSVDIYNVKNGKHDMQLPGGPYEVWVRWQNLPGESEFEIPPKDEWIRMVKAKFAEMGNTPPTDEELDKGYERVKHEKHLPLSSGVGPIKPSDRIDK
jgi:hypothetical protein